MLQPSPRMTAKPAVPLDAAAGRPPRPAKAQRASERTCIASGEKRAPQDMLRFVLAPDGVVTPDLARALPGRGVWTTARAAAVRAAIAKKSFARAFRRAVSVDADLAARIEAMLLDRALGALGMARRAGEATAGFVKAQQALDGRRVGLLLAFCDAGALGRVFGRDAAVYVAIAPGALAERVAAAARRLMDYRDAAAGPGAAEETGQGSERTK
jgi:predicted RNA-binding protein YlxR (DUF448 family)